MLIDDKSSRINIEVKEGTTSYQHYTIVHGKLYYKGRLVLPAGSVWIPKLIAEFHATHQGGHSGAFHTYHRMASNFYWPGKMATIQKFVAACLICQTHKYEPNHH